VSDSAVKNYWKECLSEALDSAGIVATEEQLDAIAADIKIARDNYGLAFHTPENPLGAENIRLAAELKAEREKKICDECGGRGRIITQGPYHSSDGQCWKCRGEGKVRT
jgi:hypothetical protein